MGPIEKAHAWVGELHAAARDNLGSPQGFRTAEAVRDLLSQLPEPSTVAGATFGLDKRPIENLYEVKWANGANLALNSKNNQNFSLTLDGSRGREGRWETLLFELFGSSDSANEHMDNATLRAPFHIPLKTGGTDKFAEGWWKVFYANFMGEEPGKVIRRVQIEFDEATIPIINAMANRNCICEKPTGHDAETTNVVSSNMLVAGSDVWRMLADYTDPRHFKIYLDHRRFEQCGSSLSEVAAIILDQQTEIADMPSVFDVEDVKRRVRAALEAALVQ